MVNASNLLISMPQTHPDKVTVLHFRFEVSLYTVNDILVFRARYIKKNYSFLQKGKKYI